MAFVKILCRTMGQPCCWQVSQTRFVCWQRCMTHAHMHEQTEWGRPPPPPATTMRATATPRGCVTRERAQLKIANDHRHRRLSTPRSTHANPPTRTRAATEFKYISVPVDYLGLVGTCTYIHNTSYKYIVHVHSIYIF